MADTKDAFRQQLSKEPLQHLCDQLSPGIAIASIDVRPNGDPIRSNANAIIGRWPGNAITVVWENPNITVKTPFFLTPATSRIRAGYTLSNGSVLIKRSSGSIPDEEFSALLIG